jgi:iron complex transport system permease protein
MKRWLFPGLFGVLIASVALGLYFGSVGINWRLVFADPQTALLVWRVRLPRVVLGGLVGACLAVAGVAFQGLLANPLADPYTLGVSSGAALGASIAIILRLGPVWLPWAGFAGAGLALVIILALSHAGGRWPIAMLLLSGVVVSSFFSAVISTMMLAAGSNLRTVLFWLMGGLALRGWNEVLLLLPFFAVGFGLLWWYSSELDMFVLGEEQARHLGMNVGRVQITLLLAASGLTAAAVSVSGMIGFIGLIIPHAVRFFTGVNHRWLLPASAAAGAAFLILTDTVARTVMSPGEIPVGIITALLGGPFFAGLLLRERRRWLD